MTPITYVIIEWSDHKWSFEEVDSITGHVIFASHTWGYPPYVCEFDVYDAIALCERARARVHGRAGEPLEIMIIAEKRQKRQRARDQQRADEQLTRLMAKARRVYTRYDVMPDRFAGAE
jgi:hypothetical protein